MRKRWIVIVAVLLVFGLFGAVRNKKASAELQETRSAVAAAVKDATPAPTESPAALLQQEPTETLQDRSAPEAEPEPEPTPELLALDAAAPEESEAPVRAAATRSYVLNNNSMKFHNPGCSSVKDIAEANRADYEGTRDEIVAMGYSPCGRCHP